MRIQDLQDGQLVRARWGRAGEEDVDWGPWKDVHLRVQRHRDRIVGISLVGVGWAEYGPGDFDKRSGVFLVEDYYLEIAGVSEKSPSPP
jgi:hypothetical protein